MLLLINYIIIILYSDILKPVYNSSNVNISIFLAMKYTSLQKVFV